MARELMLFLVAAALVCMAPVVHGIAHLSRAGDGVVVREFTRDGCGETMVCVETPAGCDPKDAGCIFTSVTHNTSTSPNTLTIGISGESTGYIGMGLKKDLEDTEPFVVFICAVNRENDAVFFLRTQMKDNEGNLSPEDVINETRVNEIRFLVDGEMIKCEFNIPETEDNMHVILGHGTTAGVVLGVFNTEVESGLKTVIDRN